MDVAIYIIMSKASCLPTDTDIHADTHTDIGLDVDTPMGAWV